MRAHRRKLLRAVPLDSLLHRRSNQHTRLLNNRARWLVLLERIASTIYARGRLGNVAVLSTGGSDRAENDCRREQQRDEGILEIFGLVVHDDVFPNGIFARLLFDRSIRRRYWSSAIRLSCGWF